MGSHPMYAVGSGGSLTTAEIAATFFRTFHRGFSVALTPLELSSRRSLLPNSSVFLATAGGSNPDILGALRTAAWNDAKAYTRAMYHSALPDHVRSRELFQC